MEAGPEVLAGVLAQALAKLGVHAGHPRGCAPEPLPVGILPYGLQDAPDRPGDGGLVHRTGHGPKTGVLGGRHAAHCPRPVIRRQGPNKAPKK